MSRDEERKQGEDLDRSADKVPSRACDSCRARKVRCLRDGALLDCKSCRDAHRTCVSTVPGRRRPRKRTDTRVAELEKEFKVMSEALRQAKSSPLPADIGRDGKTEEEFGHGDDDPTIGASQIEPELSWTPLWSVQHSSPPDGLNTDLASVTRQPNQCSRDEDLTINPCPTHEPLASTSGAESSFPDVIDRGLVSMEEAEVLVSRYVHDLSPHFPAVVFASGMTAAGLRQAKPALFLAVIAAAAGSSSAVLNRTLREEFQHLYADRVIIRGQKSLELVQSILVTAIWYYVPDRFDQVVFYQYIHMAATIALEMDLGRRPTALSRRLQSTPGALLSDGPLESDVGTIEGQRTLLSCYLTCAGVALNLRRPNILGFTSAMAEAITALETSPHAAPTDVRLVACIRLRRLMEECGTSFALDDPSATVSLEEPRVQHMLKAFENQLKTWRDSVPTGVMNQTLLMDFHSNNIILHELALHLEHDVESFRPPFLIRMRVQSEPRPRLLPAYIEAIATCLSSSHGLLDAFLHTEPVSLQTVPIINFVRMMYGIVILLLLSVSARDPGSEIGKVVEAQSLRVDQYLNATREHLLAVVALNDNRIARTFLMVLTNVESWYGAQAMQLRSHTKSDESIEPLLHWMIKEVPATHDKVAEPSKEVVLSMV